MRLGILQCDTVRPELRPTFGDYPDMFKRRFGALDPALAFASWNLPAGELPESADAADAWLISGSKWSVNDDEPWIARGLDFVHEIHQARRPILGICFGHQLVARALGGTVDRVGWGVGVHTSRIFEHTPWMRPALKTLSLIVSHQDQVTQLPEGSRILAGHAFCPYDIVRIGQHILTFQGHPEFEPGYARALMQIRREQLGESTYREGMASLSAPIQSDIATAWMLRFLGREPELEPDGDAAGLAAD